MLVKGILFVLWLLLTGLIGILLLSFNLLILPLSSRLYRKYSDFIAQEWFLGQVISLEYLFGIRMVFAGDVMNLKPNQPVFMFANHRTRLDWMMLWSFLARFGNLSKEKIILKDGLRKVPIFGYAMQFFQVNFKYHNIM